MPLFIAGIVALSQQQITLHNDNSNKPNKLKSRDIFRREAPADWVLHVPKKHSKQSKYIIIIIITKAACSSSPDVLHIKGSPQLYGVPALTFIQAELQLSGGLLCLQQT